ncbi:MAG: hypothetical protein QXV82_09760 [Ignisphaera sp.]
MSKNRSSTIKTEDLLTIEVIDKKTGKVISKETTRKSLGDGGSNILINFIAGKLTDADLFKDWKYVYLFDGSKNLIKYLTGAWGTVGSGANYNYCVLTATDDSSDAYTVVYEGLYHRTDGTVLGQMNVWQQQTKTKGADQILRVTWEVRVPYTPYP